MDTLVDPPTPPRPRSQYRGTFYFLQTVIGVAFVLATLFTASTPSGLFPDNLAQKISNVLGQPTPTGSLSGVYPTPTNRPQLKIGIVSGHWGNDSGAVCSDGLTEASVNLEIATRVKERLQVEGLDVDLLKEFDPRLTNYRAAVLVSIHADSCQYINDEATGFKVAAAMYNQYPEKTTRLTACLISRYQAATGMRFHANTITPDMSSYHAFNETNPDTPAAIIETGFLNLDRQILTHHPELLATGIAQGILCFIRNENITPQTTTVP